MATDIGAPGSTAAGPAAWPRAKRGRRAEEEKTVSAHLKVWPRRAWPHQAMDVLRRDETISAQLKRNVLKDALGAADKYVA